MVLFSLWFKENERVLRLERNGTFPIFRVLVIWLGSELALDVTLITIKIKLFDSAFKWPVRLVTNRAFCAGKNGIDFT